MSTAIDIVIVNWNAGQQLDDCLASVKAYGTDALGTVVVVDNASSDGSLEGVDRHGLPLQVVRNAENRGFAAACNQGARLGTCAYVLFLNPDTRLLPGALDVPHGYMERAESAQVGICGIQLVDESGAVAHSCSRFPTLAMFSLKALGFSRLAGLERFGHHMVEWDHGENREVDQLIGAFFFVRRDIFDALGGFDERYFVYFEEVDFSLRAKQAGWHSMFLADARAFHAGGGTSRQVKAKRLFYSLRSRLLYGMKHFGVSRAAMLVLVTCLVEPVGRLALAAARRSWLDARNTVAGYAMLVRSLPDILRTAYREPDGKTRD